MPTHHHHTAVQTFSDKQRSLTAIKLLCQLTKAVQQHRGASMAYLGGETFFMPQIEELQSNIDTILVLLKDSVGGGALTPEALSNLSANWHTILDGWQYDQFMHNFEFHSHVVDELKKLMRQCRHNLLPEPDSPPHLVQLLRLLLENLFDNIESMARLRGLSTNAAVVKACGQDAHTRISFLLKDVPEQNQQIQASLSTLQPYFSHLPALEQITLQEKTLHRLLLSIQIQILDTPEITIKGSTLFNMATEIINSRWHELGRGVQIIDQAIFDQLVFGSP